MSLDYSAFLNSALIYKQHTVFVLMSMFCQTYSLCYISIAFFYNSVHVEACDMKA